MMATDQEGVPRVHEFARILWNILSDDDSSKMKLKNFCEQYDFFYDGLGLTKIMCYIRHIKLVKDKVEQVLASTKPKQVVAVAA